MARVATHLRVPELEPHTRAAKEVTAARHYQAIRLLAKGHTVPEVAAWMAGALGQEKVAPRRGWGALRAIGWTIQVPRPRHPQAATAVAEEAERHPGKPTEVLASDEHRLGLKPFSRRCWAPRGERPPPLAGGISGVIGAHSAALKSLG